MARSLKSKKSVTLDQDVIEKIEELAEASERSFSQYVNRVLKEHLRCMQEDGAFEQWERIAEHGFYHK